jgi:WD40 repeat protein
MSLHKVKVQSLSFSADGKYLASLGGQDDNSVVVWDVGTGDAICGFPTAGETKCVKFFNNTSTKLVTVGSRDIDVWTFDRGARKLRSLPCTLGKLKRAATSVTIDEYVRPAREGIARPNSNEAIRPKKPSCPSS